MSAISDLSPDQRAVVQLLLKQGKTYGELAALLRIDPAAVRERAALALDALAGPAGEGLGDAEVDRLTDYLLGQTPTPPPADAATHAWEDAVVAALRAGGLEPKATLPAAAEPVAPQPGPAREPELPSGPPQPAPVVEPVEPSEARAAVEAEAPPAAKPAPAAEAPLAAEPAPAAEAPVAAEAAPAAPARVPGFGDAEPAERSSRLGGVVLLAVLAVIVAGVLVFVLTRSDDDSDATASVAAQTTPDTATAASTASTTTTPLTVEAQINMTAPSGGKALGVATIITDGKTEAVQIQTSGLPPNGTNDLYALWLTGSGGKANLLGFQKTPVGKNGRFQGTASLPADASSYTSIVLSRETTNNPTKPANTVLRGALK